MECTAPVDATASNQTMEEMVVEAPSFQMLEKLTECAPAFPPPRPPLTAPLAWPSPPRT